MKMINRLSPWMAICSLFMTVEIARTQTWMRTSAPNATWTGIASSADGSRLIAIGLGWTCCISTNSGLTWSSNREPQSGSWVGSWDAIASSADGARLAATAVCNSFWTSADYGITWISNDVPNVSGWTSIACSADGMKLIAADGAFSPGLIYTSRDFGATWTTNSAPSNYWASVTSSADGTKLAASVCQSGSVLGLIYTSTNSGETWEASGAPSNNWAAVAASADGRRLLAAGLPAYYGTNGWGASGIFYSTNFGVTWTSNSIPGLNPQAWQSVALSADGSKLIAVAQQGYIYTSADSGITWISNATPNQMWWITTASADGNKLVAVAQNDASYDPNSGSIWQAYTPSAPWLNFEASPDGFVLSWLIPSTNFTLQWNSDLTTASWLTLTNTPALDFTNLRNEIILPPSSNHGFYRLATP